MGKGQSLGLPPASTELVIKLPAILQCSMQPNSFEQSDFCLTMKILRCSSVELPPGLTSPSVSHRINFFIVASAGRQHKSPNAVVVVPSLVCWHTVEFSSYPIPKRHHRSSDFPLCEPLSLAEESLLGFHRSFIAVCSFTVPVRCCRYFLADFSFSDSADCSKFPLPRPRPQRSLTPPFGAPRSLLVSLDPFLFPIAGHPSALSKHRRSSTRHRTQ